MGLAQLDPKVRIQAFQFTLKAAQGGYVPAQEVVGMMYAIGKGVQQDYHEAGKWFLTAAEAGNTRAAINYVGSLRSGMGNLRRDPELLSDVILRSCRIKAEIVAADETEEGERAACQVSQNGVDIRGEKRGRVRNRGCGIEEWDTRRHVTLYHYSLHADTAHG